MRINHRNRFRNKASHWIHKVLNKLENESNGNLATNGEGHFLRSMIEDSANKKITLFDVGANTGEYGDIATRQAVQQNVTLDLHAFEPLAPYTGKGIFNNVAVSDTDGEVAMYKRLKEDDISSMYRMPWLDRKFGETKEIRVPTVRLDTYIQEKNIKHIDLLKIDVEGHELSVLKGSGEFLRPDFITYVQFEFGLAAMDAGTRLSYLYDILQSKGYKIYKIFPKHIEECILTGQMESIQYANFVAK